MQGLWAEVLEVPSPAMVHDISGEAAQEGGEEA